MKVEATEFYIPTQEPGVKLHARLMLPKHDHLEAMEAEKHSNRGIFIVCHGLLDTKDTSLFRSVQEYLISKQFGSVAFDFRGNGRSTGITGYGNYHKEAEDVAQVVEYMRKTHQVIGILGHSKGASSVLLYAAKHSTDCPPLVISVSARFWLGRDASNRWKPHHLSALETEGKFFWRTFGGPRVKKEGENKDSQEETTPVREYWITREDFEERMATDMDAVRELPLHRTWVLNIAGDADRVVPVEDLWAYDRTMRQSPVHSDARVDTHVVPGGTHFWASPEERAHLLRIIDSWLDTVLPLSKL
ncbi:hypothetical protein IW140_005836 [Coemansia sp. RSA 1813]|nr:hypothetical protein EV178_004295 [Coemansia sp. RSA 1646]KAJ1770868.1 hypothetical protein LPJ74_002854 [Coemansia sp. RSA 1843]KAJ2088847.1 hypothetical protein IW138_003919 [Coemansia sp. RSA 986]KAJ2211145.1 hypothetical protein EV179_005724 [Coemansia sp. RSA 487]KAJ2564202.1 hypothetical protein IW140_005836 [Coemansia sp. RSA 1813]